MANILSIDDDANVRRTLAKGLSRLGHRVLEAKSGRDGLWQAMCRDIDIILLDISMPGMNGMEVLRKLKESLRTQHIPVIMLTGLDDEELQEQAFFEYAENFIIKNDSISQIDAKLRSVLDRTPHLPAGWPTVLRW